MSLDNAAARERFRANEEEYCLRFGLDRRERKAVMGRDFPALVEFGAHVVHLERLAALSGMTAVEAITRRSGLCFVDALIGAVLAANSGRPR